MQSSYLWGDHATFSIPTSLVRLWMADKFTQSSYYAADFILELLGLFSAIWRLYWKKYPSGKTGVCPYCTVKCWRAFSFSFWHTSLEHLKKKTKPGAICYHVSPVVCKVVKGVFISFLLLSKTLSRVSCSLFTPGMRSWQRPHCWNFFRLNPSLSALKLSPFHIPATVTLFLTASW